MACVGSTASSTTLLLSKKLAVIITFILVSYTARSLYLGASKRRGYGPFMLCLFAFPLVMLQPILQVMQSLRYFNSYGPMTSLITFISWLGVVQMSSASLWNASADQYLVEWWNKRHISPQEDESLLLDVTAPVEEECGS